MGVLIKGKMPNTCFECLTDPHRDVWCDGLCALLTPEEIKKIRHPECPIIGALPDSYGRLIDADELEKAVEKMALCDSYEYTIAHEMIKGLLKIAPTVLEASNERHFN